MDDDQFGAAGGLADAYRAVDWASGPLGDPGTWSPTLRSTLDMVLRTEFPVSLFWGPELVLLYNAAYVSLIGEKHPEGLGAKTPDVFDEAWSQIGPWMHSVLDDEQTVSIEDALVPLLRHGFLEDCHFTFSYSPVVAPDGTDRGVINIATETTTSVVAQRRLRLLGRLLEVLAGVEDPEDLLTRSILLLREGVEDIAGVDLRPTGGTWDTDATIPGAPRSPLLDGGVEEHPDGPLVWLPLRSSSDETDVRRVGGPVAPVRPVLVVRPSPRLPLDEDQMVFLRLVAAALGQALDRFETLAAERALSEALQRSLLGTPHSVAGSQVAVRYQPAADLAQIGGDWHDSFELPGGRLALAIGDVAGHDQHAAAAMAQTRNLMRGIAHSLDGSPAATLDALDRAMLGLGVGSFATSVLAIVQAWETPGSWSFTWSNAGHPPPVLLRPDGSAQLLVSGPELLLGVHAEVARTDRRIQVEPGSSVLLYTDGLIERRTRPIDEGMDRVVDAVTGMAHLDPDALCDLVLEVVAPAPDDDIALLCVRLGEPLG